MIVKNKLISGIALLCLITGGIAAANTVTLSANQQTQISYRLVHQTPPNPAIYDAVKTVTLSNQVNMDLDPLQNDLVGMVIVSVNGHNIPEQYSQFNNPNSCAITTSKDHPHGELNFDIQDHVIKCMSRDWVAK